MQLVMRRQRIEGGVWFRFLINARIVADDDENFLFGKYKLRDVTITPGNTWRDLKIALFLSFFLALIAFLLTAGFTARQNTPPQAVFWVPLLVFLVGTYFIFQQIREAVIVNDLIAGRDFKAHSFVELYNKEQKIRKMCFIFAYLTNQAKTWDKSEVIELDPQVIVNLIERATLREFEERAYEVA
jgi:hypothetical protein